LVDAERLAVIAGIAATVEGQEVVSGAEMNAI
jgi:hypothetical protein